MGLMGENGAGKSTMMKCLFGTYQKDEGKIFLNGKEINFSGPKDALENGIAMVHQELNQCLERSVIDNLFLGRYPVNSMGVVDEGQMKKKAADLFRKLGMTCLLYTSRKARIPMASMVGLALNTPSSTCGKTSARIKPHSIMHSAKQTASLIVWVMRLGWRAP